MPKLKDIAAIAGVSISTVSKALNDSSEIKKETKANIIRIARELNYDLDSAQAEKSTKTNRFIGVICPEIDSNYYTQLISSLGARIAGHGYSYAVSVTDFEPDREERYLQIFGGQQVSGIVLITENDHIQTVIDSIKSIWHIPLLLITTGVETNNYDCIHIDDRHGVITGVEYLIRLGHKKIAYLGDNLTEGRLKAYRDAMARNNITVSNPHISISNLRYEECGYQGMKAVLSCSDRPTAVFAAYDDIAIGAMRAISEQGLSIPDDISIIGMDNVTVCPYLYKSLTTVSNPIKEMADVAVGILARKIEDPGFTVIQNVALKPTLVIRETTRTQ